MPRTTEIHIAVADLPAVKAAMADLQARLDTAVGALQAIRHAGCANSKVVAMYVAWGLQETPAPVLTRPTPGVPSADPLGDLLRRTSSANTRTTT